MRFLRRRSDGLEAQTRFGFAVVGLGHGAEKFLEALDGSSTVAVRALVSGDAGKARRWASRYGIPQIFSYADFDRISDSPTIDAVYLSLPVALHGEFTLRAAAAGKHVLSEKPMAPTPAECLEMIEACRCRSRLLMVGYRCWFDPAHQHLRRLIAAGVLGPLRTVEAGFGFRAKPGWRLTPELAGGGSLFDLGTYPVNLLNTFFPDAVALTSAKLNKAPGSLVETAARWQGSLGPATTFSCRTSFEEKIPSYVRVVGERGSLTLKDAFAYKGATLEASSRAMLKSLAAPTPVRRSTFRLEAEHLAECVRTGRVLETPGEMGLGDVEMLAGIYSRAEPTL